MGACHLRYVQLCSGYYHGQRSRLANQNVPQNASAQDCPPTLCYCSAWLPRFILFLFLPILVLIEVVFVDDSDGHRLNRLFQTQPSAEIHAVGWAYWPTVLAQIENGAQSAG